MKGPREIGPYRIEERLGIGGMGEVWRAWDERLARSVAVKLIRPEASENDVARERFRREARAAAALSHPAIVQIHDLVSSDEGEALVMELVEGEPLSRRIADGPLAIDEAVRLGKEIAEGLAAAHARGLLHRDLKTENVMVTRDGHAKILDFGLAKRLDSEASLTQSAMVVGTFRSMSPEQARGLPLDPRSDLFSLGVLLYETLTGQSPFRGASAPDTLTRICTARQAPVREVRPEVPAALSGLVDRLLEKDPDLRPQSARQVAAALAGLGGPAGSVFEMPDEEATRLEGEAPPTALRSDRVPDLSSPGHYFLAGRWKWGLVAVILAVLAGGLAALLLRHPPEPLYVAVLKPRTPEQVDRERSGPMASGVRLALLRSLRSFEGVFPLGPEQVDEVSGSVAEVARMLAASEVITSSLECDTEVCSVSLSRVRGQDGSLLWSQSFAVPLDRSTLLPEVVQGHLRKIYSDRRMRDAGPNLEVREKDYAEFLRLFRSFDSKEEAELPVEALLKRLEALRASSPRFLDAYLFEVELREYRFRTARDPIDLQKASDLLLQARELDPGNPGIAYRQFDVFLLGRQLDRAEEALAELEDLQPGDATLLARRARLLELRGETRQALAAMETAARRLPSWKHLFWAADMEYRAGRIDEARRYLQQLLARSPGNYVGQSKLAEIELMSGSPRRAAELYAGLVSRSPQFEELTNLGLACFLLGRYPEAEQRYRQALALAPRNPFAVLNLADVTLLRGKEPEARALYGRVLESVESDPTASANAQLLTVQAQALAHLGRNREAVEAVQKALRLAPDNPQTAYEASLVYSVLGDRVSALFNAEKALDQGFDPRWFAFPWFEPLRTSPELRRRLERAPGAAPAS